jgi:hypothetical protein
VTQRVTVSVGEIEDFEQSDFHRYQDQFQHALILPSELIRDELGITPYSYVDVTPNGRAWDEGETVYLLPFADGFELAADKPGGLLKGSYQERIFEQRTSGTREVDIRPHSTARPPEDETRRFVPVRLPVEKDTGLSTCYINKGELEELEFTDGDTVEVYNPMNGNRASFRVEGMGRLERGTIAVGNVNRDSLGVISVDERSKEGWGEELGIRKPIEASFPDRTLTDQLWHSIGALFVGYNRINLEVRPGLDIDEERRIVRVEPDTRNLLGIDSGDRVIIEWGGTEHNVKCLDLPDSVDVEAESATSDEMSKATGSEDNGGILTGNHSSNHIYMPSTERKAVNACIEDLVKVRRNMKYTMGKQVSLSILGILAALVAGEQFFSTISGYVSTVSRPYLTAPAIAVVQHLVVVSVFLALSILLIWVLLYQKRQECEI